MMNIIIKNSLIILLGLVISSCAFAPGMHMDTDLNWSNGERFIYIESIGSNIQIEDISIYADKDFVKKSQYKIGNGDQIAVTVWGLQDIFPIANISQDLNLRRVDTNGNIFFPYAGIIQASGRTQDQLREDLTAALSQYFNDPQVDVAIAKYNSQQIFILGEVTRPIKINITDIPVSLSDAVGESFGLNTNTASGSEVFIIRQGNLDKDPKIFHADLSSPSGFLNAGQFFLMDNDIVYVNSSKTARWNKVISQFFPFSTFLNSVDSLVQKD